MVISLESPINIQLSNVGFTHRNCKCGCIGGFLHFHFLLLRWKLGGEEILIYLEMWKSFADFAANIAETTDCDEHEDK